MFLPALGAEEIIKYATPQVRKLREQLETLTTQIAAHEKAHNLKP